MSEEIESSALLAYKAVWLIDQGKMDLSTSLQAKVKCTLTAIDVALKAMLIFAGYGPFDEQFISGYLGDALASWLLEGTGQMQRNTAAGQIAQGPDPDGGRVVFGQNLTIESGEIFAGDLVVFGGNVTIEENARLDGNLVVFGGQVTSDGEVAGDLAIIGGQVILDQHARVTGDVVTVGGQLQRAEGSVIEGEVVNNVQPEIVIPNGRVPVTPKK